MERPDVQMGQPPVGVGRCVQVHKRRRSDNRLVYIVAVEVNGCSVEVMGDRPERVAPLVVLYAACLVVLQREAGIVAARWCTLCIGLGPVLLLARPP
jgi:hypothetical protein